MPVLVAGTPGVKTVLVGTSHGQLVIVRTSDSVAVYVCSFVTMVVGVGQVVTYELTMAVVVVVYGATELGGGMPVEVWVSVHGQSVIVKMVA